MSAAAPSCSRWPTSAWCRCAPWSTKPTSARSRSGQRATVTVDAYPNRPFEGTVLKIEPQAQTEQNVTMFPVLVRIDNRGGLLRPGMNARSRSTSASATTCWRCPTRRSAPSATWAPPRRCSGLSPRSPEGARRAAAAQPAAGQRRHGSTLGGTDGAAPEPGTMTMRDGRTITLPAGVTEEQVRAAIAKRREGGTLSRARPPCSTASGRARWAPGAAGAAAASGVDASFGGRYIVFVKRPEGRKPVWIRTGLTDLDYSEVVDGLEATDSVLVLPSASLVQSQQESQERINRITGGGGCRGCSSRPTPAGAAPRREAADRCCSARRSRSRFSPSGPTSCARCSPCWASSSASARSSPWWRSAAAPRRRWKTGSRPWAPTSSPSSPAREPAAASGSPTAPSSAPTTTTR